MSNPHEKHGSFLPLVASLAVSSMVTTPAVAQPTAGSGPSVDPAASAAPSGPPGETNGGLRLGGGLGAAGPVASGTTGTPFDRSLAPLPIGRLDAGYRFGDWVQLGTYLEGGTSEGSPEGLCGEETTTCQVALVRFGVGTQIYLLHQAVVQPWLGIATGYQWLSFSAFDDGLASAVITGSGAEHLRLSGGVEYRVSPTWVGGAHLSYSTGRFQNLSYEGEAELSPNGRQHHWIGFGVTFALTP